MFTMLIFKNSEVSNRWYLPARVPSVTSHVPSPHLWPKSPGNLGKQHRCLVSNAAQTRLVPLCGNSQEPLSDALFKVVDLT